MCEDLGVEILLGKVKLVKHVFSNALFGNIVKKADHLPKDGRLYLNNL